MGFPKGFLWGTATAAAQIEGAAHEDGKEDSIWDAFARVPDAIAHGDSPEIASDHYHRMPEDVALMKELGLGAARFSTSWARIKPGARQINQRGLDFYSRLVDELLEAGIMPWLTLYHWDLPQALQELGGWANRDTAYRFREFAIAVHAALGDRVSHWTTFNEPLCSSLIAYASGEHAPGLRDPRAALAAVHHQHLAHGLAVEALRANGAEKLGITLNLTNAIPNKPGDPVDIEASRRVDALFNRMYLEPVLLSRYPADLLEDVHDDGLAELIQGDDLQLVGAPIDFLGVNYYHDDNVSGHPLPEGARHNLAPTTRAKSSPFVGSEYVTFPSRDLPRTAMDWEVNPDGLRALLVRLGREYPHLPPLYVTENGGAYGGDVVGEDGRVHDPERAAYIKHHVKAVTNGQRQRPGLFEIHPQWGFLKPNVAEKANSEKVQVEFGIVRRRAQIPGPRPQNVQIEVFAFSDQARDGRRAAPPASQDAAGVLATRRPRSYRRCGSRRH